MGSEQLTAVRIVCKMCLLFDLTQNNLFLKHLLAQKTENCCGIQSNVTIWSVISSRFILSWHLVIFVFTESSVTQWTQCWPNRKCYERGDCFIFCLFDRSSGLFWWFCNRVNQDMVINCWRNQRAIEYVKINTQKQHPSPEINRELILRGVQQRRDPSFRIDGERFCEEREKVQRFP